MTRDCTRVLRAAFFGLVCAGAVSGCAGGVADGSPESAEAFVRAALARRDVLAAEAASASVAPTAIVPVRIAPAPPEPVPAPSSPGVAR